MISAQRVAPSTIATRWSPSPAKAGEDRRRRFFSSLALAGEGDRVAVEGAKLGRALWAPSVSPLCGETAPPLAGEHEDGGALS